MLKQEIIDALVRLGYYRARLGYYRARLIALDEKALKKIARKEGLIV